MQTISGAGGIASGESVGSPTLLPQGFNNVSFEVPGTQDGFAAEWTITASVAASAVAGWGPAPEQGVETYERGWGNEPYRSDLLPADVTPLAFTNGVFTTPFENYEDGWGNTPYNQDLGSITAADFGGAGGVESYEDGWSNAPLYDDVPDLSAPETEDYESGWPINDGPITDLLPIDVTTAEFTIGSSFASSTVEVEDYESVNFDQLIELADAATNFMTVTAHGFVVGEKVSIVNVDGFPPGGLFTETVYFVKSASPNAFTLALSAAGPILDITDGGSGTNYVRADPTGFWTGEELRF